MRSSARGSISVPIVGGLGNQMFLVATGIATALRNRMDLIVPHVDYSDSCAEPRPVYWKTMLQNIAPFMQFVEGSIPHLVSTERKSVEIPSDAVVLPETEPARPVRCKESNASCVLRGFFQSPLYFDDYRENVAQLLVPRGYLEHAQSALDECIAPGSANARDTSSRPKRIGIHIRRGDYLTMRDVFPILSPQEYYFPAIESLLGSTLLENVDHTKQCPVQVIVFTEDTVYGELFRDMLRSKYPLLSVHPEAVQLSAIHEDYLELLAMSLCDDLIIANSSFSWWGAYLNRTPLGRIIAPKKWFVNRSPLIYCANWRKL